MNGAGPTTHTSRPAARQACRSGLGGRHRGTRVGPEGPRKREERGRPRSGKRPARALRRDGRRLQGSVCGVGKEHFHFGPDRAEADPGPRPPLPQCDERLGDLVAGAFSGLVGEEVEEVNTRARSVRIRRQASRAAEGRAGPIDGTMRCFAGSADDPGRGLPTIQREARWWSSHVGSRITSNRDRGGRHEEGMGSGTRAHRSWRSFSLRGPWSRRNKAHNASLATSTADADGGRARSPRRGGPRDHDCRWPGTEGGRQAAPRVRMSNGREKIAPRPVVDARPRRRNAPTPGGVHQRKMPFEEENHAEP